MIAIISISATNMSRVLTSQSKGQQNTKLLDWSVIDHCNVEPGPKKHRLNLNFSILQLSLRTSRQKIITLIVKLSLLAS